MRRELSVQRSPRQRQRGDALPATAARHADPATEGDVGRPAVAEDAERVGELRLERQQRSEVGVVAAAANTGGRGDDDDCCYC